MFPKEKKNEYKSRQKNGREIPGSRKFPQCLVATANHRVFPQVAQAHYENPEQH